MPITGDKKEELTEAHKKLLEDNVQHLFTATFSVDKITDYLTRVIQSSLNAFQGSNKRSVNVDKVEKVTIVSVTGMFDLSRLHMRGNALTSRIQSLSYTGGFSMDETLKKMFAFSNFQYMYDKVEKMKFLPNT